MVISTTSRIHSRAAAAGSLMIELAVATALLLGALFPLAYSFASEKRLAQSYYQRAVAMEIVDGELEALAAGGWRDQTTGTHEYAVRAASATNLPPGKFLVTIETNRVRLQWLPQVKDHGGAVTREAPLK
jgi:hypothetical protein